MIPGLPIFDIFTSSDLIQNVQIWAKVGLVGLTGSGRLTTSENTSERPTLTFLKRPLLLLVFLG